jgi:hypothetical protein
MWVTGRMLEKGLVIKNDVFLHCLCLFCEIVPGSERLICKATGGFFSYSDKLVGG